MIEKLLAMNLPYEARAQEAERPIEAACLARFGTLRADGPTPILRSDNG